MELSRLSADIIQISKAYDCYSPRARYCKVPVRFEVEMIGWINIFKLSTGLAYMYEAHYLLPGPPEQLERNLQYISPPLCKTFFLRRVSSFLCSGFCIAYATIKPSPQLQVECHAQAAADLFSLPYRPFLPTSTMS